MSDDSDVSVSSSSDDDFLTLGAKKSTGSDTLDREAMVRKKLLENFYGRKAVADALPTASMDVEDDDEFLNDDEDERWPLKNRFDVTDDLDSPAFDADAHTRQHVKHSSMHTLLDTEEQLSLSVRTLDTEMQALVYENYTRFIDATDAIRSIGVNVKANEPGLVSLSNGMSSLDDNSRIIEESLGSLRDQVAEKIRIKRLLTRLDTLLKLPQTLRDQIANGECRSACRQFLQASSILKRHSEGFESLKSIETECNSILEELKVNLNCKLNSWSGRTAVEEGEEEPEAPRSVRDIFECSGTLYLLRKSNEDAIELQQMYLSASMRLLDRLLDTHMIEVQERRYNLQEMESHVLDIHLGASTTNSTRSSLEVDHASLVPRDVLANILDVAKLWAKGFGVYVAGNNEIVNFVSEAFASFLMQVRAALLDESTTDDSIPDDGEAEPELGVSVALALLVGEVQKLAQGLTHVDVGMSTAYASSLVAQAQVLTDTLVRRRVDQKFIRLRLSIVEKCLVPFVQRMIQERRDCIASGKPPLNDMVQIANVALSDCLQLVDDAIRSTFAPDGVSANLESNDLGVMKQAVHASINRFSVWLANAFEMLAGGESCDAMQIVDAKAKETIGVDYLYAIVTDNLELQQSLTFEEADSKAARALAVTSLLVKAHKEILASNNIEVGYVDSDYILTLAETCRLATRSFSDMLEQSMSFHSSCQKKRSKGLFEHGGDIAGEFEVTVQRFQIAASRLLVLYSSNRGSQVADKLIESLCYHDVKTTTEPPQDCVLQSLQLARDTGDECSELFGVNNWAGVIPVVQPELIFSLIPTAAMVRKTGLHLDVERMFKESINILPSSSTIIARHPSDVMFLVLKVAFKALLENVRVAIITGHAYRQLQVNIDLLKLMVPHYVRPDVVVNGSNASTALINLLSDAMHAAGERCLELETVDSDQVKRQSFDILSHLMASKESNGVVDRLMVKHAA
ncbi:hypothetical protein MPSEU_000796800 [Mayamaea pseudoterrestris]|nr:hypothetical protein MPSEU_000796800 [Mayamaea pseudoterrestris]